MIETQTVKRPLVTVVMPAYNAARYIEESIRSVQSQTVTDWELIVVDDCSADDTCGLVEALAAEDPRIRLVKNEENSGVARTRNRAMDMAQGSFVAFLDSDDIWYSEKLEKQLDVLQGKNADLCYASYRLVKAEDKAPIRNYRVPEDTSFEDMLGQNRIGCSTVLMTRELADRHRFTTEFYHEDYVLWLRMLQQGAKMVGVADTLVDYRYYPTSKAGNKAASAGYRWDIYRRCLGLNVGRSTYYLAQYALAGVKKYWKVQR